ncbi:MAG: LysR family transcriptional regulator [Novosphingobium sp.]
MDWNALRIFLGAVRAGSYSAAGPRLGINRTTVGRHIAELEKTLGVNLFRFDPTGPTPTPEGRLVLDAAARMEQEIAALVAAIDRQRASPVTIRLAGSAGIHGEFLGEIAAFRALHPDCRIELIGATDPIEAITQRRADIAVVLERTIPRRVAGIQVGTVTQARYRLRGSGPLPALGWGEDVETVLPRHWTSANAANADAAGASFNSWVMLKDAVAAGMGEAWLCRFVGSATPALERSAPSDPRFNTDLWVVHRAATPQGTLEMAFERFLAERLKARLAAFV